MERGINESLVGKGCVYAEPFGWHYSIKTIRPLICFAFDPGIYKTVSKDLCDVLFR
jgi:hypothetical protein